MAFSLLPFFYTGAHAQPGKDPRAAMSRKIEALKAEFLTKRLDLTPGEAQKFWPVYNSYQKELSAIFRERHEAKKAHRENGANYDELKYEARILELKKKYKKGFSDALPQEKVETLYTAEREFREQLINQLRKRRDGEAH